MTRRSAPVANGSRSVTHALKPKILSLDPLATPGDCICAWRVSKCREPVTHRAYTVWRSVGMKAGPQPNSKQSYQFFCERHAQAVLAMQEAFS